MQSKMIKLNDKVKRERKQKDELDSQVTWLVGWLVG